jgi:hypothetical protein
MKIIHNIWTIYALTIFGCIFFSGTIIKLYGETCGIDIFTPSTWIRSALLMGSPYCRMLNYIGQISGSIMENMWVHIVTTTISRILISVPFMRNN